MTPENHRPGSVSCRQRAPIGAVESSRWVARVLDATRPDNGWNKNVCPQADASEAQLRISHTCAYRKSTTRLGILACHSAITVTDGGRIRAVCPPVCRRVKQTSSAPPRGKPRVSRNHTRVAGPFCTDCQALCVPSPPRLGWGVSPLGSDVGRMTVDAAGFQPRLASGDLLAGLVGVTVMAKTLTIGERVGVDPLA